MEQHGIFHSYCLVYSPTHVYILGSTSVSMVYPSKPLCMHVKTFLLSNRSLPDKSVDLRDINIVQLLHSCFDLRFVCSNIHNENQSIIVFNFLHCRLSCQRMLDDSIVIKLVWSGSRDSWILGVPSKAKSFGSMEFDSCLNLPARCFLNTF